MSDYMHLYPLAKTKEQVIGSDSTPHVLNFYFQESGSFLDIGGNRGNILHFNCAAVNQCSYTSIDVSKDAIKEGKTTFYQSKFLHWDRFNWIYNKTGSIDAPLPEFPTHDYSFACNVFNSTDFLDLLYIVESVWNKTSKKFVFSVYDKSNTSLWTKFYDHMKLNESIIYSQQTVNFTQWCNNAHNICYLKDNCVEEFDSLSFKPVHHSNNIDCKSFLTGYDLIWLYNMLKLNIDAKITIHDRCQIDSNMSIVVLER